MRMKAGSKPEHSFVHWLKKPVAIVGLAFALVVLAAVVFQFFSQFASGISSCLVSSRMAKSFLERTQLHFS